MNAHLRSVAAPASRRLAAMLLLTGSLLAAAASAPANERDHGRGYVKPADHDRIYAERLRPVEVRQELPEFFSWVTQGGMTPVKNQGSCGSCWAFAGIGQIEAHLKIYYGQELDLSEQQIIDCNPYGDDCGGGWQGSVYWVASNYGVTREAAIPYQAGGGGCTETDYLPFAFVDDWYYIPNEIDQIKTALLDGPVCAGVFAGETLEEYNSGCIDSPIGGWTNHLIVIVGWDDRGCGGTGAWICKNSWGPGWGSYGYFNIGYGVSAIGEAASQIELAIPPVDVVLHGPDPDLELFAHDTIEVSWSTHDAPCSYVDIWVGEEGFFDTRIAQGMPPSGSFAWELPNFSTDRMRFCVVADGDTRVGFDISDSYTVVGHKTVYVSTLGSDTPPYETPATAAHDISAAVLTCAGRDTVLVAGGDYAGTAGIDGSVWLIGGWDDAFAVYDPQAHPTRIQSTTSGLIFLNAPAGYSGVVGVEFHDCIGVVGSMPAHGYHGGGVYCSNSSPLIRDCTFVDNSADPYGGYGVGGGLAAYGGSPRLEDCVFIGGLADQGGAVALFDPVAAEIVDCEFLSNDGVQTGPGHEGGALYVRGGSVTLSGNRFEGNGTVHRGGALYAEDADLDLVDNVFVGNQARDAGGAIAIHGGTLSMRGGALTGNASAEAPGAGLHADQADAEVRNVLVSANTTPVHAAGVYLDQSGTAAVENCIFMDNVGGGPHLGTALISGGESLVFRNNIVADNQGGGIVAGAAASIVDYNQYWNNGADVPGWTPGPHDLFTAPLFVDTAGGDYGLALHAPGLDRGDPEPACNDLDASRNDLGLCGGPLALAAAPAAIQGAQLVDLGDGRLEVSWDPNTEPDVDRYVVYTGTASPFVPAPERVVAEVPHPGHDWIDEAPAGGYYLVVAVDAAGHVGGYSEQVGDATPVDDGATPRALAVRGVTPNPFNPRTRVAFDVPGSGPVRVRIHDTRGRVVRRLVSADLPAGRHETVWDGRDDAGSPVAAGVYLVRISDGRRSAAAKLVLAK